MRHRSTPVPVSFSPVARLRAAATCSSNDCPKGGNHVWATVGTLTSCSRCGQIRW